MKETPAPIEILSSEDRLGVVLEQLKYVHEHSTSLDEGVDLPESIQRTLESAVEELGELLAFKDASVSGTMVLPTTDEYGHVTGTAQANGTIHNCKLSGVSMMGEAAGDGTVFIKGAVVLQFSYGRVAFDTYTEESEIIYKAIFPVTHCSINVADDLQDIWQDILPEDDDVIAEEIDLALLNTEIDLTTLSEIVRINFPQLSEMQQEMYLRYIQKVGDMSGRASKVSSQQFSFISLDTDERDELVFSEPQEIEGTFQGYTISIVEDEQEQAHYLLAILVYSPDLNAIASVFIQDIEALSIR